MSNAQVIYQYYIGKGLPAAAAAALAGNFQVESGDNPDSYNAAEQAVGLANWEGGRRTALQQFAAARGTTETDLQTQLDFSWHELTTDYRGVLSQLQQATDPSAAAAVVDAHYEVSSGSARQQRENNAQQIYQLASSGGDAALANYAGSSNQGGGASPDSAGSTALTEGAGASTKPTTADYSAIVGLGNLLSHIPELKGILESFTVPGSKHYGGSVSDFQDAIEGSTWWKTNSATTRQYIALSLNDPAEYQKQLSDAERTVNTEAGQLGVHLNAAQTLSVAHAGLLGGNLTDKAWLDKLLAGTIHPAGATNTNGLSGQLAATVAQLQQIGGSYGQTSTPQGLLQAAQNILSGQTTMDTYTNHYKTMAKSMFPGLSSQIDSGMTVSDLASPYQQTMGNLLEIDPSTIKLNDPLIRKALQGTSGVTDGKTTTPTAQPIWQFENTLRADPRWALTQNAKDTASTALTKIGQDWGYL